MLRELQKCGAVRRNDTNTDPHPRHIIGNGIDGPLGDDLRAETRQQDILLVQVDSALDAARLHALVRSTAPLL
jgi:hypothetical protein